MCVGFLKHTTLLCWSRSIWRGCLQGCGAGADAVASRRALDIDDALLPREAAKRASVDEAEFLHHRLVESEKRQPKASTGGRGARSVGCSCVLALGALCTTAI